MNPFEFDFVISFTFNHSCGEKECSTGVAGITAYVPQSGILTMTLCGENFVGRCSKCGEDFTCTAEEMFDHLNCLR